MEEFSQKATCRNEINVLSTRQYMQNKYTSIIYPLSLFGVTCHYHMPVTSTVKAESEDVLVPLLPKPCSNIIPAVLNAHHYIEGTTYPIYQFIQRYTPRGS